MKTQLIFLSIFIILLVSVQTKKISNAQEDYSETVQKIQNAVKDKRSPFYHASYERLAYIVDTYGPRLWGSETLEMVIDDLISQGQNIGFDQTYRDPVTNFTKWVRGAESLTLYDPRPFPQDLKLIGLGESVPGDVKAEVLVVTSWDDLELKKDQVKGKIVCYSVPWQGYDTTVSYRSQGAIKAAQYGGVAALVRSVTPFSIESPHTGAMSYSDNYPKVPAAAISVEDANMFKRMQDRGQKIVVHLKMENESVEGANSANVIAEIHGTEYPNEIVLFGGHIDSWDTGSQTGANDDGGGFATCFEALRVLKDMGLRPKRTLRFIAWSGEEYGGSKSGAAQYVQQHMDEMPDHVLGFESDEGSTTPYGYGFTGNDAATKIIQNIAKNDMKDIDCTEVSDDGTMVDTGYLAQQGVPTMKNLIRDFSEEHPYYFTFHHSGGDTMDIMDPDMMDDNVIMIASMMYVVADMEERLPRD